jgi:hypothetical protein
MGWRTIQHDARKVSKLRNEYTKEFISIHMGIIHSRRSNAPHFSGVVF